jgi:iron complex transport system substrate-binding protein
VRVVSVLPSATEIVCALGEGASLVGRSEECDYPTQVEGLPVVMRARRRDGDRPSGEIDARVRDSLARAESLYTLDVPLIERLRPDLLLTQDLCRVCSVTEEEVAAACALAGLRPKVVSLSPRSLDEVWESIETIADALGAGPTGHRLAETLRARSTPRAGPTARVAVLEWIDPLIESGLWTPEMIGRAGASPYGTTSGKAAIPTSLEALEGDPPDLVIVSPCSFSVARTVRELQRSPLGPRLASWRLPRGVWIADEAYFSRPGPRLAEGLDLVDRLAHGRPPPSDGSVVCWDRPAPGGAS